MPNTITAINVFITSTLIDPAPVNNNFSNLLGNLIPLDPTAGAAINAAYNLGTETYAWRGAYITDTAGSTLFRVVGVNGKLNFEKYSTTAWVVLLEL